jgi:transcriptional regulator with XRE-family HTH domain
MPEPTFDLEALYGALDAKRRAVDISWRKAAEQMGVSASTLTRMAQGASPDVEGFGKMVRWLGESADQFVGGGKKAVRPRHAEDLRVVVSRHLRASKELSPESAKALENIIDAAYRQMKAFKAD